jgi:hypothetical protein
MIYQNQHLQDELYFLNIYKTIYNLYWDFVMKCIGKFYKRKIFLKKKH